MTETVARDPLTPEARPYPFEAPQFDIWKEDIIPLLTPEPDDLQPGELREVAWPEQGIRDFRLRLPEGRTLAVQTHGRRPGKPLFLLPGTPSSRIGLVPSVEELEYEGYRLITYDRPGYGSSDRQAGRVVADAAGDVRAIADALGLDRFTVIGRSGGAPHALACGALLGSERIEQVIALGATAPCDAEGLDHEEGMGEENSGARAKSDDELVTDLARQSEALRSDPWYKLRDLATKDLQRADYELLMSPERAARIAASHWFGVHNGPYGWIDDAFALDRRPWGFDLGAIETPVSLWVGTDDLFTPRGHSAWLAQQIPNAKFVETETLSHFTAMDLMLFLDVFIKDKW